jgi:hypothetical protein
LNYEEHEEGIGKIDRLAFLVIPAKAGIQFFLDRKAEELDPSLRSNDS